MTCCWLHKYLQKAVHRPGGVGGRRALAMRLRCGHPRFTDAVVSAGLDLSREMWLENPYESVGVGVGVGAAASGDYVPMRRIEPWTRPAANQSGAFPSSANQSGAGRHSLCKRPSLVFICLWIITLIFLFTTLGLYLPTLNNSSTQRTADVSAQKLADLMKQQEMAAALISELQMEVEDLDHFYTTQLMCFPNYSSPAIVGKMSEISRKNTIIIKPAWWWISAAAVDVTLDPDTAHPMLIVSEDGKQVRLGLQRQDLPDTPERFDYVVNVLGKEAISWGRRYWEVQVESKTDWTVGVAMSTVNRKGPLLVQPRAGYWTVRLKNGVYSANRESPLALPLRERPRTVGLYVDYEGGQVSFYNVEARSHIYSFTGCSFTEKLYPLFRPGLSSNGQNLAPLIII